MRHITLTMLFVVCTFSFSVYALTVYDPNYRGEVWLEYPTSDIGICTGFTFGQLGEIYTSHTVLPEDYSQLPSGSIHRITPDKQINLVLDDLIFPRDILWSDGSIYEEGLVIANQFIYEPGNYQYGLTQLIELLQDGTVLDLTLSGIVSSFKGMTFGEGRMYEDLFVGREDGIFRLSGQMFLHYAFLPYAYESRFISMAFDSSGKYEGSMFAGLDRGYFYGPGICGLYRIIDQDGYGYNGMAVPYSNLITSACGVTFDTTMQQEFGGYMYVIERDVDESQWSISRVLNSEMVELLAVLDNHNSEIVPPRIQFAPDGSLFAVEANTAAGTTKISRIFKYKTPLELTIEHLKQAIDKESQMLQQLEETQHHKMLAVEQLELALSGPEQNFKKSLQVAMMRDLKKAIIDTENAKAELLSNLEYLDALVSLLSPSAE